MDSINRHFTANTVYFNGIDNSITISTANPVVLEHNFSIQGWVRCGDSALDCAVFEIGYTYDLGRDGLLLRCNSLNVNGVVIDTTSTPWFTTNTWCFFHISRVNTNISLHIDGVEKINKDQPSITTINVNGRQTKIGCSQIMENDQNHWLGNISEFRIIRGEAVSAQTVPIAAFPNSSW